MHLTWSFGNFERKIKVTELLKITQRKLYGFYIRKQHAMFLVPPEILKLQRNVDRKRSASGSKSKLGVSYKTQTKVDKKWFLGNKAAIWHAGRVLHSSKCAE
jgi:hypothetical protein